MTEKLYYSDSHLREFDALVLSCAEEKDRWAVTLDRTAFFPEGGGQSGDIGVLGEAQVLDTREKDGVIVHFCDRPLMEGSAVHGVLDWETRFTRMQCHSGEHIVSGLAHSLWGCENVGFHMAPAAVTLDFDRELSAAQLAELEKKANAVVWDDRPIRCSFPDAEVLAAMTYRQKKALSGDIRIVEVEGVDRCACCAPHVSRTGEIGLIRFADAMRHRGGIRITMQAGAMAYTTAVSHGESISALSRLFSAPRDALLPAAERLFADLESVKGRCAALERQYVLRRAADVSVSDGNLCLLEAEGMSSAAMRELCEALMDKCSGMAGVFSGSDAGGYKYVIGSRHIDLRRTARDINAAIGGRGGGSREMIQGSAAASAEVICAFFGG